MGDEGYKTSLYARAEYSQYGVITGWLVGNADINERWLLSAFLSVRAGCPELVPPPVATHASKAERAVPPARPIGAFQGVGQTLSHTYLADRGFNSARWRKHWADRYAATVLSVPPVNDPQRSDWSRQDCLWLASHRQIVETVFSRLVQGFDFEHLNATCDAEGKGSKTGKNFSSPTVSFNVGLKRTKPAKTG